MLRSKCPRSLQAVLRRHPDTAYFSSSPVSSSHQPNAPLDLDPTFQALLKDVDMSLLQKKSRHISAENRHARVHRELEVYPQDPRTLDDYAGPEDMDFHEDGPTAKEARKSPAALFGSQRIGTVVLPFELQNTITRLIAASDKHSVHADAKRLFTHDTEDELEWETSYDVKYKSRRQAARHAERDGTAFASVALPSHYSAIFAVLDHAKRRIGPDWKVERVIDWGSGTGTGLWASSHSFQKQAHLDVHPEVDDAQLSQSTVSTYLGIDKRDGLVSIGKRLVQDVDLGGLGVSWQKTFQESDRLSRSDGGDTLALSAFMLSSLPDALARKNLVKEIWQSGADVMVLIDHNSTAGFECIAEAREYLLQLGRKELEDPVMDDLAIKGSHVVAPCPHDGACPLYYPGSSKLVCGFSQRLQRPAFVRKTKHSGVGHEDTGYSYVVIRRGKRPTPMATEVGRVGVVGKRELDKIALEQVPIPELFADDGSMVDSIDSTSSDASHGFDAAVASSGDVADASTASIEKAQDHLDVETALRLEAYTWPRLVFPPLKRNGHVILDGCTAEGKIMRMTIPKSQGKQPYYDARKSGWGDIFPHAPKNAPQERHQPKQRGSAPVKGEDIGKRRKAYPQAASYRKLSDEIAEQKQKQRRQRTRSSRNWEMEL